MNDLPLQECLLSESEILRYRIHGQGPIRLVLVHGLAARAETWSDLLPLFPPQRYTVYLLDLLGSGESSKPRRADYSILAHARRMLEFLQRQSLSEACLVGHSLGGAVVLMAALEDRQTGREGLVGSLVVMAGPGFVQRLPWMARIFRLPLTGTLFTLLPAPEAWVRLGLEAAYHDRSLVDREHVARYSPCYRQRDAKRALVETCRRMVPPDAGRIAAAYPRLRLPVLLLWGRHDRIVPLQQGERLLRTIPGARLEVLDDCGHNPQEERPRETFRILERFLAEMGSAVIAGEGER